MKAREFLKESKKIEPSKPRNFVAKNSKLGMGGAGVHKDKKKAMKQGDVKHKKKELDEVDNSGKIQQLETIIANLEQLMPAVMKLQKNHYEFEAIEDEIRTLTEPVNGVGDKSAIVDLTDAMEAAVSQIRQANAAVYEIEKTLKSLIKHTTYALDDARDEEQYESRFGSLDESSYGKYWCSTDKKWKYRKGPKQTRSSK